VVADVVVLVVALLATGLALGSVALGLLLWRLGRRNRLHPSTPTPAPVAWLLSPARPARLHRRLRAAVLTAHFRAPGRGRRKVPTSAVDELVAELLREAVAVDHQLVVAARAPLRVRTRLLGVAEPQVAKLEQLAARLAVLVSATATPGGAPAAAAIGALEERLDALEAARQEIADLEAMLQVAPRPHRPLPRDDRA
jgi:hypothetical protein